MNDPRKVALEKLKTVLRQLSRDDRPVQLVDTMKTEREPSISRRLSSLKY